METMFQYIAALLPQSFGDTESDNTLQKKLRVIARIFEIKEERIEASYDEIFALTADALLPRWERFVGLPVNPTIDKDIRRAKVMAKLLSTPYMTKQRMENIINQFVPDKSATIIEMPSEYAFAVNLPSSQTHWLLDIYNAVENAKPAHLKALFLAIYYDCIAEISFKNDKPHFSPISGTFWTGRWTEGPVGSRTEKGTLLLLSAISEENIFFNAGHLYSNDIIAKSNEGYTFSRSPTVRGENVSGLWIFPSLGIHCGKTPEDASSGNGQNQTIKTDGQAITGACSFSFAGVNIGTANEKTIATTCSLSSGAGRLISCGNYHAGQEVA